MQRRSSMGVRSYTLSADNKEAAVPDREWRRQGTGASYPQTIPPSPAMARSRWMRCK